MIVILGGGLSGSLLAYRLSLIQPTPQFLLIESKDRLGGNHTWSFHGSDLSNISADWVNDLVNSSWNKQEVKLGHSHRVLSRSYHSISSTLFHRKVEARIKNNLVLNSPILGIDQNCVLLSDRKIEAKIIFDARGIDSLETGACGFQKFVGIDLELSHPHGLTHPILMDTNCEQKDGYRFFYLLPWTTHTLLVEDTRYSSNPALDTEEYKSEIRDYCKKLNWIVQKERRIEKGVLPIPFTPFKMRQRNTNVVPIGLRGGYFHWTTGYSFSFAVKVAEALAQKLQSKPLAKKEDYEDSLKHIQKQIRTQSLYFSALNRMLFLASQPSERWKIFHRFYKLKDDLIFRFYEGNLKTRDQIRILIGKPPVPIGPALKSILFSPPFNLGKDSNEQTG